MHKKVVTFGEIMMRLSPPGQGRFLQTNEFNVLYAGSEANVASSLSLLGIPSEHVTCFPSHDFGKAATASLKQYGVLTDHILYQPGRIGVYFIEHGASVRSPKIIYDRFDSCFANIDAKQLDWNGILKDAQWFHWSGITPAVSQSAADACFDAVTTAKKLGVTVSGDINYRRNLWQYGKQARDIMPALIENTDLVIAGVTDFENCVGISGESFQEACKKTIEAYPNIRKVATTVRETINASHNRISAVLFNGHELIESKQYDLNPIVDRVGAGDAFMAGLIYGIVTGRSHSESLEFATAACALKHSIEGDVNTVTVDEVDTLIKGDNVGKLLR